MDVLDPEIGARDLAVMEASAVGVPCVVSDVSVVREVIREGENGFLVPYGDAEAAEGRVGQLIRDSNLRRRLGAAGARMMRERFDVRQVAQKYEEVYLTLLKEYGSEHPGA